MRLMKRYQLLTSDQKGFFYNVMTKTCEMINASNTKTYGRSFVLQGGFGVVHTYTLSILRDMSPDRGLLT